jgi:hypothetical protein
MPATFTTATAQSPSKSGVSIYADTSGLSRLARDLRLASPAAWKALRTSLRMAAEPVAEDARSRVGYSSRIEYTIKVRTTAGGNVKIVAGGEAAPNAAPIENGGKGFVRHPTFGNKSAKGWTSKNSHPAFLAPAFDAHKEAVMKEIEADVYAVVERVIAGDRF